MQVPRAAPLEALAVPAFTTQSTMAGVVGEVSGTRGAPGPGRGPSEPVPVGGGRATPEQPQDPGEWGPSPGAAQPVAPVLMEDVDLPDADPALHTRLRRMMSQHSTMRTGQVLGVNKATRHRIDVNAGARPVRFAPCRAGGTAREAETAEVKRQREADVM